MENVADEVSTYLTPPYGMLPASGLRVAARYQPHWVLQGKISRATLPLRYYCHRYWCYILPPKLSPIITFRVADGYTAHIRAPYRAKAKPASAQKAYIQAKQAFSVIWAGSRQRSLWYMTSSHNMTDLPRSTDYSEQISRDRLHANTRINVSFKKSFAFLIMVGVSRCWLYKLITGQRAFKILI